MSNEYYTNGDTLVGGTTANAADVKAEFDAIQSGLDKLPTEAQLKSGNLNYAVDSGVADAYVLTMPQTWTSYADGKNLIFKVTNTNTGPSTINVDGLGVKSLNRTDNTALQAGDLLAGSVILATYDGTNFQIQSITQNIVNDAQTARTGAETAQGLAEDAQAAAETARSGAETAETNAGTQVTYATEWATKAEDSLISAAAGGDESTDYSAYHWAQKAQESFDNIDLPDPSGNDGKVIKSDGANHVYEDETSDVEVISSTTLAGGELYVDFTLPSGYSYYRVVLIDVNANARIELRTSVNSGSTFSSTPGDYVYGGNEVLSTGGGTFGNHYHTNADTIITTMRGDRIVATFDIFPQSVGANIIITSASRYGSSLDEVADIRAAGARISGGTVNAVRIYPYNGNTFISGTIKLYGVK